MMQRPHEAVAELLPAYAIGALDADDLAVVEEHLEGGCADCDRELGDWGQLVDRLAEPVEPVAPSPVTRARVLAAVGREAGRETSPRTRRGAGAPFWLALAASLVALLLAGWATLRLGEVRSELARTAAGGERTAASLAATRADLDRARTEIARVSASLPIVASPVARSIVLAGLPPAPRAGGTTVVDPRTGAALFYAHALPAPAPGKTYELWYITAGGPVAAGVFDVDAKGDGALRIEEVPDPELVLAWAVTLEPAGGVPQPTGEMVLKG